MSETTQFKIIQFYSKMNNNFVYKSMIYLMLNSVLFHFIHELGHLLTAIIFGGKAIGIYYDNFCLYAATKSNSVQCRQAILIGGTLFACIVALIIETIAIIKKNIYLHLSMAIIISAEICSWGINAVLGMGDAALYLSYINPNFLFLFGFVFIMLLIGIVIFIINMNISFWLIEQYKEKHSLENLCIKIIYKVL